MDYKYCVYCGEKLRSDAKFCDHCGRKQPELTSQNGDTSQQQLNTQEQETREATNGQRFTQTKRAQPSSVEQSIASAHVHGSNANSKDSNKYQGTSETRADFKHVSSSNAYNESDEPGLLNSFDIWIKNALHPNVCMGRADFWWGYLGMSILVVISYIALFIASDIDLDIVSIIITFILFAWILVLEVWSIPVSIERIHDTGRSGWNYCWCFLPFVGTIILIILLCQPTNRESTKWPRP